MFHRKNNKSQLLILGIAILLLATACSGAQASTPPEEVVAAEAAELAAEPESAAVDESKEQNPSFEETVKEAVAEAQSESPSEPAALPEQPLPSPTPIVSEQTSVDSSVLESETTLPTLEAPQPSNEEAPSDLTVDPSVGSLAPEFALTTLDGENISLADLHGKNVLINYWATWCPPCLNELTALENIQSQFEGQDFVVVTINGIEQDNLGDVQATVQEYGITYPVLLDENESFWDAYRILFLPTSIYINEQGIIRFIKFGEQTETEFSDMIEQLLSDQL
jgi:peroxiredoxin